MDRNPWHDEQMSLRELRVFRVEMEDATRSASAFGRAVTGALESGIIRGKSFSDVLKSIGARLSSMALSSALKPLESIIDNTLQKALAQPLAGVASASSKILPFARGGVVSAPTLFPMANGMTGLAGEAGPEAILPLRRGADGRLGVAAPGSGSGATVTLNITTPDAQSFVKAENQVAAAMARAVARGQRYL